MKVLLPILLAVALSASLMVPVFSMEPVRKRVIIIDTEGKDQGCYKNFCTMLQKYIGLDVTYDDLYSFLDRRLSTSPDSFDAAIFMAGAEFLDAFQTPQAQGIISWLNNFQEKSHSSLLILTPPTFKPKDGGLEQFKKFLAALNIDGEHAVQKSGYEKSLSDLLQAGKTKQFAATSLYNAKPKPADFNEHDVTIVRGLKKDSSWAIGNRSDFWCEIDENYARIPLDAGERATFQRNAFNALKQHFLDSLGVVAHEITAEKVAAEFARKPLKLCEKQRFGAMHSWLYHLGGAENVSCAWVTLDDAFLKELDTELNRWDPAVRQALRKQLEEKAIERLANSIFEANFDILWLEAQPEKVFATQKLSASHTVPSSFDHGEYCTKMRTLAQALKTRFRKGHRNLPLILIGMWLTTNFKGDNRAVNPVTTFFGRTLPHIPGPLDYENYWKPQIIDPFAEFVKRLDGVLPIDGIIFDCEIYTAPEQATELTNLMDFSDFAWNRFRQKKPELPECIGHCAQDRIDFLQKQKLLTQYQEVMQGTMKEVAGRVKSDLQAIKPNLLFAAYTPSLPTAGFYRALFSQLSSKEFPLLLATFNSEFVSHQPALEQEGVYVLHLMAAMLSKFKEPENFALLENQLSNHHGVWFNRWSRMAYAKTLTPETIKKDYWWAIEFSPMDLSDLAKGIKNAMNYRYLGEHDGRETQ